MSPVLKMDTPPGVQLIGFADDLAVVGMAVTGQQLEDAVNHTLTAIDDWMQSRGLELSHQKNEAVILSRRRAFIPPRLTISGRLIPLQNEIRYLGVILDKRLTFAAHADTVATKATRSAAALIQAHAQYRRSGSMEEEAACVSCGKLAVVRRSCLDPRYHRSRQNQG